MTDPQTPATEAGRLMAEALLAVGIKDRHGQILAIEAAFDAAYAAGRADALREAADAVRALHIDPVYLTLREVLAILDPQQ